MAWGKYLLDTLENAIFRRVVWVIFGGDLEKGREGLGIPIYDGSDFLCNVLVDEQDGDILALSCKLCKGLFYVANRCLRGREKTHVSGLLSLWCRARFGPYLVVDDKKILLALFIDVANACQQKAGCRVLNATIHGCQLTIVSS